MKRSILAGAGILMLATAGVALAQTPPAPPPGAPQAAPPPPPPGEIMGRPMGGRMGGPMMGGFRHHGPREEMHPPKGAVLSFRKDDARIFVKCPDDEQMRACVDALSTVLDKLGTLQGQAR